MVDSFNELSKEFSQTELNLNEKSDQLERVLNEFKFWQSEYKVAFEKANLKLNSVREEMVQV